MRRQGLALVVAVGGALAGAPVRAEGPVAVVAVPQDGGYKQCAIVAHALRLELAARGRTVRDPVKALGGVPAGGGAPAERARDKLKAAVKHYDGLDFKKARAGFKEAVQLFRQALALGARVPREYLRALHYLGASALYDSDRTAAADAFRDAQAFSRKARPDASVFPPDVFKAYDEARAGATGTLRVSSSPAAVVRVNGRARGVAPLTLKGLRPGTYIVQLARAGYEIDAQWIPVAAGAVGEVRTELKGTAKLDRYRAALEAVAGESGSGRPGPAVRRLGGLVGAESLILVDRSGGAVVARWAEGGHWVKQYRGTVARGSARDFARKLMASTAVVGATGCSTDSDCTGGRRCQGGACVEVKQTSTPVYKKWWFWTIIGVAVAGGATAGIVVGTTSGDETETWKAVVTPGGVQ